MSRTARKQASEWNTRHAIDDRVVWIDDADRAHITTMTTEAWAEGGVASMAVAGVPEAVPLDRVHIWATPRDASTLTRELAEKTTTVEHAQREARWAAHTVWSATAMFGLGLGAGLAHVIWTWALLVVALFFAWLADRERVALDPDSGVGGCWRLTRTQLRGLRARLFGE